MTKHTHVDKMIKQSKVIQSFPESAFDNDKYIEQQDKLLPQKRKKNILTIASEKAKIRLQELDWSDRIYTRFFIAGYYQVGRV